MSLLQGRSRSRSRRAKLSQLEMLESRALLAVVAVNAGQVVRQVDTQLLGVNLAWWDSNLNTTQTQQMVQAAGLNLFRFPGGSSSDDFHFNAPPSYQGQGTDSSMASFVASVHGQAVITLDYGSGSPQEAAAMLAYFNSSVSNTTVIGTGQEWSDAANAWQTVDWKTAGYWASLRAATPLAQDDGLNFLRLGHAAPFAFHDYEVGNEEYGSWEIDHHAVQHDPATYVAFAKAFANYASQIDSTISIGVDSSGPGTDYNNWIGNVLQLSAAQGLTPGFISDHNYVQAPGSESDSNLLLDTVSAPGSVFSWASRASGYESLLTQDFGAAGKNVELLATEYNSVYSDPGKQSTSLVNGLFVADSLGSLLETQFNGANVWDLRNGYGGGNASSSLYGWRQGGDYGLLGSPGTAPSTGTYVPYPTYFAEQLGSKIIQAGGTVVTSSSSDPNMAVYAVHEANGDLELLVINKSAAGALTGQFQLSNFVPATTAQLWQYGEAQDTAQSQTTDGHSALANSTVTLSLNGSSFSYSFQAYSMTVLDLTKGSGTTTGPTILTPAAATPNPVNGKTTAVSVSATDPAGAATLTYTWSTTGTTPAGVTFAVNGTNAAQSTTATFARAGTYTLLVTIADPSGFTTSSSVKVIVNQTLTSITISPGSSTLTTGATQQFAAQGFDQFGNALATPPSFSWSVISGAGTITTAGLYTAPAPSGTARVQATSGGVSGTAGVTINAVSTSYAIASYTETSDWGSGFVGSITITNTGTKAINGWTLQFDFAPILSSIWNAAIVSHTGNHYVIQNVSWDASIAPGQSVNFGFIASPGRAYAGPTHYVLNGITLPPPPPPSGTFGASVTFADTNDWGTGFAGTITIKNTGTQTIEGWNLQFDSAIPITGVWGATLLSHTGTHYVFQDVGYDGIILPGQSITFGFNGTPGHPTPPTNYILNGVALGGSSPQVLAAAAPQKPITIAPPSKITVLYDASPQSGSDLPVSNKKIQRGTFRQLA
jgi:alpha-L-arabinofuranosidase